MESSLARGIVYKFLSYGYRYPDKANQGCLQDLWDGIDSALSGYPSLYPILKTLHSQFVNNSLEQQEDEYIYLFGHAVQGNCPAFETEYGEAEEGFQKPHELGDIRAFYRAAGLKPALRAYEREDFIATELEFMYFLLFKQAYAEEKKEVAMVESCKDIQRKFLQDHLARWAPAFTQRVMHYSQGGFYATLSKITLLFIMESCNKLGVLPGSDGLRIRLP